MRFFVLRRPGIIGQYIGSPINFRKSIRNYWNMILLVLMGVLLFSKLQDQIHRIFFSILILSIAIQSILMFKDSHIFYSFNYLVMLKKVAVNFLKLLGVSSLIISAFVISFSCFIKYQKNEELTSIVLIIFKVFLMLAGDFDFKTDEVYNVFAFNVLLVIFVVSVTIIMMNLMVGLVVSDIANIQKNAELYNCLDRIKLLRRYQPFISNM
jgi:hypothetical protein